MCVQPDHHDHRVAVVGGERGFELPLAQVGHDITDTSRRVELQPVDHAGGPVLIRVGELPVDNKDDLLDGVVTMLWQEVEDRIAEVSWRRERDQDTGDDRADTWPPIVGVDDQLLQHDTTPFAFGLELIIDALEDLLTRRKHKGD